MSEAVISAVKKMREQRQWEGRGTGEDGLRNGQSAQRSRASRRDEEGRFQQRLAVRQEDHERRCLGAERLGLRKGAGRPGALEEQRGAHVMDRVSREGGPEQGRWGPVPGGPEPAGSDGRDARAWVVGSEQEIQVWSCWHPGGFGTGEVTVHQGVT